MEEEMLVREESSILTWREDIVVGGGTAEEHNVVLTYETIPEANAEDNRVFEEEVLVNVQRVENDTALEDGSILDCDTEVGEKSVSDSVLENLAAKSNSCIECGKKYTTFSNLCRHIRNRHAKNNNIKLDYRKCQLCPICDTETISKKTFEEHLFSEHNMKLEKEELRFVSIEAFNEWKKFTEKKNRCMFVQRSGKRYENGVKTRYFYCHRTGDFRSRSKGKRALKKIGSNKIAKTCPSRLKVMELSARVKVEYIKTHIGHSFDVERMRLSNEEKKIIADKLAKGMTVAEILKSIERPPSEKVEPIHLITRKDINNIRNEFKIPSTKKSKHSTKTNNSTTEKEVYHLVFITQQEQLDKLFQSITE